jgi:hypothetical protein
MGVISRGTVLANKLATHPDSTMPSPLLANSFSPDEPGMALQPSPAPPPPEPVWATDPDAALLRGHGERALMCAVLEDAIRCLMGQGYPGHSRRLLASRARAWIEARDHRWPFSFECICDALGIESSALRRRLLRSRWELIVALESETHRAQS